MRHNLALGALFVATTTSLTVTVTGLAGLTGVPGADRLTPSAAATGLVPFEGCEELRQWYVDEALPDVGPYGLHRPVEVMPTASFGAPAAEDLAVLPQRALSDAPEVDTSAPAENSGTGTNVQEVGVDEPDRAKTDGSVVVHVRDHELVVTDVNGDQPREIGTLALPRDLGDTELLLAADTVLVVASETARGGWGAPMPTEPITSLPRPVMPYYVPVERSRLLEVSIATPAQPELVSDQSYGGALVSARQYDDTVRLVLSTTQPLIDFVEPNRGRTPEEAIEENRQILRDSTIEDWLPTVTAGDGPARPLVDCAEVRHPAVGDGHGTLTVVTLDAEEPTAQQSVGVTTSGSTVYSSTDRLYLATPGRKNTTDVHAFALDGGTTAYSASGSVDGVVADRWSMDEHEGVLRLALGHGHRWSPTENGVTTLREQGGRLEVVGSVRGLGPDEEIKSVRWFDDLAVVVTFRQVDPLYTVDLSDPTDPRPLGELKIPGFSEYLHPIGDDRLLGLGVDATNRGEVTGGQASLFDIAELSDPQRLDTLGLGPRAYPFAGHDPRTFTWLPDRDTGLAVVEEGWSGGASVVEIEVDGDSLSEGRSWSLPRWDAHLGRTLPLPDGQVAIVGSSVDVVDLG